MRTCDAVAKTSFARDRVDVRIEDIPARGRMSVEPAGFRSIMALGTARDAGMADVRQTRPDCRVTDNASLIEDLLYEVF